MTSEWDPDVLRHLQDASASFAGAGVIDVVRQVVQTTWEANLGRWSPSEHFDDTNTLGYQTSRNVNNRLTAVLQGSNDVAPGVFAETESGIAIIRCGNYRLRVVKAPIESGVSPDFQADFDWSGSLSRSSAARRNQAVYHPLHGEDWTLTYDSDPRPAHRRRVDVCHDVFLIWAAELVSTRTLGWLGLPTLGDLPWMGVSSLWCDAEANAVTYVWEDDADS